MDSRPPELDQRELLQRAYDTIARMEVQLAGASTRREPIAIVGLGLRFAGGAHDADSFWRVLRDGVDVVTEVPSDRWDLEAYYDADPEAVGKSYSRWGAFLDGIDRFDAGFFGISPREAAAMDPQQRLLLEVTWEALENAGHASAALMGSSTGIFVGMVGSDYSMLGNGDSGMDAYFGTGISRSIAAGRLSYALGVHGPSMAIDTACSSSAVATHLACQSLRLGECDMAVAGGVNVMLSPLGAVSASRARMMSFTGRCRAFAAAADGYVRAEGCAMVVLRRLSDAVTDRDNILGVILGTAANQDGRSNGITAPNGQAQERLLRAALQDAGIDAGAVSLIEAHGTGTSLGDPIEMRAIGNVFGAAADRAAPLMVSSVKTNIGHTEAVAGTAGLIKLVLSLQHRTVPPHLHLDVPNPLIPWNELPVIVPTAPTPWSWPGGRLIAGVSSFGFSGTNSHIILAEPPRREARGNHADGPRLITLSARTGAALEEITDRFIAALGTDTAPLEDITFTASTGRTHREERLAVRACSAAEAATALSAWRSGTAVEGVVRGTTGASPEIAFLFTGQGSQYVSMGRNLYDTEPVFRHALDRCAELLHPELERPLLSVLFAAPGSEEARLIDHTAYTQPALFAVEYALAELWRSRGVQPTLVMGHSAGEYVAACVAGVFSLEDGLRLIAARGRLMQALPAGGSMAAVFTDEESAAQSIAPFTQELSIAAVNGPRSVVLSGVGSTLERVLKKLAAEGVGARRLLVSHAFHSPLMEPMLDDLAAVAETVSFSAPAIGLISNISGRPAGAEIGSAAYWRQHVRAPVRFADSVRTLVAEGCTAFLEVGPAPTLIGMAQRCVDADDMLWLPSLRPGTLDTEQQLDSIGALFASGVDIDWHAVEGDRGQYRTALPTYAFQRQRYWANFASGSATAPRRNLRPLLDERLRSPLVQGHLFQSRIGRLAPPYLDDHRIFGVPLFPATGFLELCTAAAAEAFDGTPALENVQILEPLPLPEEGEATVQLSISTPMDGVAELRAFSLADEATDSWKLHATAQLRLDAGHDVTSGSLEEARRRCSQPFDAVRFYDDLAAVGVGYGPSFRGLAEVQRTADGEALARVALPDAHRSEAAACQLHPALLDACLQLLGPALPETGTDDAAEHVYLPIGIGGYRLQQPGHAAVWCHARIDPARVEGEVLFGTLRLFADDGSVVADVSDLRLRRVAKDVLERARGDLSAQKLSEWLYDHVWAPAPEPAAARAEWARGNWLVLADHGGSAERLAAEIRGAGGTCLLAPPGSAATAADAAALVEATERQAGGGFRGFVHVGGLDLPASDTSPLDTCRELCNSTLELVKAVTERDHLHAGFWLITRGAQALSGDTAAVSPAHTALWGLGSTIAAEHPSLGCVCIDLDAATGDTDVAGIARELASRSAENRIVLRSHGRYVSRLVRHVQAEPGAGGATELVIRERGVLDSLVLSGTGRRAPGPGEVEVAVRASGLNFRDVLNALGMYPGDAGALGSECAGTVVGIGDGVESVRVGDTVIALAGGTFRSHVITAKRLVYPVPAWLGVNDAAGIPIAFLTAWYGLHELAGIRAGDRVLIHAAAGGVGLAAVQLAQRAGAVVFATAGSPDKHAYLRGIGVEHVMSSRSIDFADEVMRITDGTGVDIVLNALADEFIPASLGVLRTGGCFLEIGKRGVWTTERVTTLNPTLRYHMYDLSEALQEEGWMAATLDRLMPAFESGDLKVSPLRAFPLEQAEDAFRFMARARHIGKIVLTQRHASDGAAALREDATYLVTGGLGGLGLLVAAWLADSGARNIVLLGRNPPDAAAGEHITSLEGAGVRVLAVQADVAEADDVRRALGAIQGQLPPLRGVIHAAGVIDDGLLPQLTWERFEAVMRPKVLGSWHLHDATRHLPLDFFVLFSTGSSIMGAAGQANYAAANGFLDGLAHHRRSLGLPATSINWGAWSGVGMAATVSENSRHRWRASGLSMIGPRDGIRVLGRIMDELPTQVAVLPFDWSTVASRGGAERPLLSILVAGTRAATEPAASFLDSLSVLPPAGQVDALNRHVHERVAYVLGLDASVPLTPTRGLSDLGMDSLMAVELSRQLQTSLGCKLPSTLAFEFPTLAALTQFLAAEVLGERGAAPEAARPADDAEQERRVAARQLTDEEAELTLLRELEKAGY
jgi:acyl transferase domain-containing protein/NADPH:quinone reductase-like Zn-dependent oxidoreductase/acyl carrier protein